MKGIYRLYLKRMFVFLYDNTYFSCSIAILLSICYLSVQPIKNASDGSILGLFVMAMVCSYASSIFCGSYFIIFQFLYTLLFETSQKTYDNMILTCNAIMISVCLHTFLVSIYQIRHDGFSKSGIRTGLQVVNENGSLCPFWKLLVRNFMRFSGGCSLFFIPSILPGFDKTGRSMFDRFLKIKLVEGSYTQAKKKHSKRKPLLEFYSVQQKKRRRGT